jgi:hypothetical protein
LQQTFDMWTSEDNWYQWAYNGDSPGQRFTRRPPNSPLSAFTTEFTRKAVNTQHLSIELDKAAKSTLDHYPGLKPAVFFSGGVDSELILRAYINIGANPTAYIIRYDNQINQYDVDFATRIASDLNVRHHIIDFDLTKFYECGDAITVAQHAEIDRPRMLPHLKFTDCTDDLIIVGHSDVRWYRPNSDYDTPTEWIAQDFEHDIGCDKYNIYHNRPAIYQWWKWTPELLVAYTRLNWFQNLINDQYRGKLGINSTKYQGFTEVYPNLLPREKRTGFEPIDHIIDQVEQHLQKTFSGLPYRGTHERSYSQFINELT